MEKQIAKVAEYVKTLRPIEDFTTLEKGRKIFNRCSISVAYVDTFVSYDKDYDVVTYLNCKNEEWTGQGKGYWYFID